MRNILVFCFIFLGFMSLNSQAQDDTNKVFTIVQQKPQFQGDVNKWLADNINYPKQAVDSNVQGTVYVMFIVEKDGSVSNIKILRGVAAVLDNEAIRVISSMPKWIPGMQNGQVVRVQYIEPIHFVLRDGSISYPITTYKKDTVYNKVQVKPEFPGDINKYLSDHIMYPEDAKGLKIQGTVYVSFVIEMDGSVSNVKLLRGVRNGEMLNDEAIKVISNMPKWTPGMQDGKTVRVQYMVPIHFILRDLRGASSPQFPYDLNDWISKSINYPKDATEQKIQGDIYVNFTIENNGSVSHV